MIHRITKFVNYPLLLIIIILLVVSIFKLFVLGFRDQRGGGLTKMLICKITGYEWHSCNSTGPCGCFEIFSDAGKACESGNECISGKCIIEGGPGGRSEKQKKDDLQKKFIGKCRRTGLQGKPFLFCGEASIENGRITEDNRSCIY